VWKLIPETVFCVDAAARASGKLQGGKVPVIRVETHPPVATATHPGTAIRGECTLVTIHTAIGVRHMGVSDAYINSSLRMAIKLWPGTERDVCLQRWETTRDERPKYLKAKIADVRRTDAPRYGMCADGYTKRSGAPTSYMIRLDGEKRWRRVMCWCFSNAGTCFVRVARECLIIPDHVLGDAAQAADKQES
jgi:hypothetical protein